MSARPTSVRARPVAPRDSPLMYAIFVCARRTFDSKPLSSSTTLGTAVSESRPQMFLESVSPSDSPSIRYLFTSVPPKLKQIPMELPESAFQFPPVLGTQGRRVYVPCLSHSVLGWKNLGSSPKHTNCVFLIALALAVHHQPPVLMVFPSCVATTLPPAELVRSKF